MLFALIFVLLIILASVVSYIGKNMDTTYSLMRKKYSHGKLIGNLGYLKNRRQYLIVIKEIGLKLGFRPSGNSWTSEYSWEGKYGEREIRIRYAEPEGAGGGPFDLKISMSAPEQKEMMLSVWSMQYRKSCMPWHTPDPGILTNDEDFDSVAQIDASSDAEALALLHPKVKSTLALLFKQKRLRSLEAGNGSVDGVFYGKWTDFPVLILSSIDQFGSVVTKLCRKEGLDRLLIENYHAERSDDARLSILKSLNSIQKVLEPDDELIKHALSSKNKRLQFEAIMLQGGKGYDSLAEFYKKAPARLKPDILNYMTRCKVFDMLPYFLVPAHQLDFRAFQIELIRFFQAAKSPDAEDFLLRITSGPLISSDHFTMNAVQSLAECGGCKSIPHLQERKNDRNRQIINDVIARIQSRTGVGEEGWLSVNRPGEEEGTLALENNKTDSGQLSMRREEK